MTALFPQPIGTPGPVTGVKSCDLLRGNLCGWILGLRRNGRQLFLRATSGNVRAFLSAKISFRGWPSLVTCPPENRINSCLDIAEGSSRRKLASADIRARVYRFSRDKVQGWATAERNLRQTRTPTLPLVAARQLTPVSAKA